MEEVLWIDYTNWKGVRDWRECFLIGFEYGIQPHHGDVPQWFMHVKMVDREDARRTLAFKDIHAMKRGGSHP